MTTPSPYEPTSQPAYLPRAGQAQHFVSAFEQPTVAYAPPAAPAAPQAALPVEVPKRRLQAHGKALIWAFGIMGFLLLGLIGYYLLFLGPGAVSVAFVLALLPLAVVFFTIYQIDRWEPEPKGLVFFALAWGAVASIVLTLLFDLALTVTIGGARSAEMGTVIQAPVVEEVFKGLGVFLIFLMARAAFDGPVDGVVYGALVGAGFAFTENIQYFAVSFITGGGLDLTFTFFLRGILSPFAHVMFTALTGFAIGLAARKGRSKMTALLYGLVGLAGAILLHAFWNGSAVWTNFFGLYFALQVPLFIGYILAVIALRREEARLTFTRLSEYADAGWFTPDEVTMLATRPGQRTGLAWAATLQGDRRPLMKEFIKDANELAVVRQRAISNRDPLAAMKEQALLARTAAIREALLAG